MCVLESVLWGLSCLLKLRKVGSVCICVCACVSRVLVMGRKGVEPSMIAARSRWHVLEVLVFGCSSNPQLSYAEDSLCRLLALLLLPFCLQVRCCFDACNVRLPNGMMHIDDNRGLAISAAAALCQMLSVSLQELLRAALLALPTD